MCRMCRLPTLQGRATHTATTTANTDAQQPVRAHPRGRGQTAAQLSGFHTSLHYLDRYSRWPEVISVADTSASSL